MPKKKYVKKSSPKKTMKKGSKRPAGKKKSTASKGMAVPSIAGCSNSNININEAENGFVVSVGKSTKKDGYQSKQYIAKNEKEVKSIVSKAL